MLSFGDIHESLEKIIEIGEQFVATLYSGTKVISKLDDLRYLNITTSRYAHVERMTPTNRAIHFHCLRVHYQVSTWITLKTVLDKEYYGFKTNAGSVVPSVTKHRHLPIASETSHAHASQPRNCAPLVHAPR